VVHAVKNSMHHNILHAQTWFYERVPNHVIVILGLFNIFIK
jgi:hypothetical protein